MVLRYKTYEASDTEAQRHRDTTTRTHKHTAIAQSYRPPPNKGSLRRRSLRGHVRVLLALRCEKYAIENGLALHGKRNTWSGCGSHRAAGAKLPLPPTHPPTHPVPSTATPSGKITDPALPVARVLAVRIRALLRNREHSLLASCPRETQPGWRIGVQGMCNQACSTTIRKFRHELCRTCASCCDGK